jgi:hypothetical protein
MEENFNGSHNIPRDVFALIVRNLPLRDFLAVSSVCKSWMILSKQTYINHINVTQQYNAIALAKKYFTKSFNIHEKISFCG